MPTGVYFRTKENCENISKAKKGFIPWNKGKSYHFKNPMSEEHKIKIGLINRGRKHTEEAKRHMSEGRMGMKLSEEHKRNIGKGNSGSNCHLWKGGITKEDEYDLKRIREYRRKRGKQYVQWCSHKRRLSEQGLSLETVQLVYEDNIKQYGTLTCYLCLQPIPFGKDQLEHKTPLSRGGTNEYNNLGISCQKCNCKKHNKTEEEYRQYISNKGV